MNPQEDDMYNCPSKPEKWTKPLNEDQRKRFILFDWLDEVGNITEKGRLNGVCQEMLDGTETEDHFQWRMKFWEEKSKLFWEWFDKKWGENGKKPQPNLPYPTKEMKMLDFRENLYVNPKENDLYNNPFKPEKWIKPMTELDRKTHQERGWIDENENPTKKGRLNGVCQEMLNGTETEEHFQWRMRVWKEECKIFEDWFNEKEKNPQLNLSFPSEEMRRVKFKIK